MNLKQAKFLRSVAKDVHSEIETPAPAGSYLYHKKRGYRVNHPASFRGIYRRIKRESLTD